MPPFVPVFSAFLLLMVTTAFGVERPTLPGPGEDMVLTQGKSAREFFEARAARRDCRLRLESARRAYRQSAKALRDMVQHHYAKDGIDTQEARVKELREELLVPMEECGECATRDVERRTLQSALRREVWYVSDGSCQLDLKGAALEAAYTRVSDSLLHIQRYAKKNGGLHHVLEFTSVNPDTGELEPDRDTPASSPFYAFIAVQGPTLLGQLSGFSYYARNDFTVSEDANQKTTRISFSAAKEPEGYESPEVHDTTASGERKTVHTIGLSSVMGSWYVTSDGYLRYFTAADFKLSMDAAADYARAVLLDTVVQLSERATGDNI